MSYTHNLLTLVGQCIAITTLLSCSTSTPETSASSASKPTPDSSRTFRISPREVPSERKGDLELLPFVGCFRVEYAGPKTHVGVGIEYWENGTRVFGPEWDDSPMDLPFYGRIMIGFGSDRNNSGFMVKRVFPAKLMSQADRTTVCISEAKYPSMEFDNGAWSCLQLPRILDHSDSDEAVIFVLLPTGSSASRLPWDKMLIVSEKKWLIKIRMN
jgi:hypothetical protein